MGGPQSNVDDSVAAKSLSFNKIQQVQFCKVLILQGLRKVENLVPNQIQLVIEIC